MLAKPKYSSPPDEVCCWPERRGRAAGREYHGEEDGGTVAESYREDVAGRGAVAERLQRGGVVAEMLAAAWRIAIGKKLLPGRAIGKKLLAGAPWQRDWPVRRCCTIGKKSGRI